MPVDSSIALNVRQPEDAFTGFGKALQLKSLVAQQQAQDRALQQEQAINDAYRTSVGQGGELNRPALLSDLANRGLGSRIPGLQKQFAEADKAGLEAKNTQSQISERDFKITKERLGVMQGMVSSLAQKPDLTHDDVINTVAQYAQQFPEARDQAAQFVRNLPGDPRALRQSLITIGLQAADAGKRLDMMTPKVENTDLGNRSVRRLVDPMTGQVQSQSESIKAPEGFIVGKDGRLSVDPGYLGAKSQIAAAGSTKLSINTAKPLLDTMAEGLGKQLDSGLSGAQSAVQTVQNAQTLRKMLASGNLITGPGADARVIMTQIGSALGVGGKDDAEKLANTRLAMQAMAKAELDAAQSMKGQGAMSDAERALVKRAAGGDISMSAPELKALAAGLEKNARARIGQHQQNVERLRSIPQAAGLIPFYEIQSPAEMQDAAPGVAVPPNIDAILKKHGGK